MSIITPGFFRSFFTALKGPPLGGTLKHPLGGGSHRLVLDIRKLRESVHVSQAQFAKMIGVIKDSLQNWEQGRRHPRGPAKALPCLTVLPPFRFAVDPKSLPDTIADTAKSAKDLFEWIRPKL
jgi:DNA-binding XRE family transcriptional regulator